MRARLPRWRTLPRSIIRQCVEALPDPALKRARKREAYVGSHGWSKGAGEECRSRVAVNEWRSCSHSVTRLAVLPILLSTESDKKRLDTRADATDKGEAVPPAKRTKRLSAREEQEKDRACRTRNEGRRLYIRPRVLPLQSDKQ